LVGPTLFFDGGVGDLQLTLPVGAAAVVLFANRRVDEQQGPESQFETAVVLFANRRVDEQQGPESQFETQPSRL
jgi:hypothetical protein